MLSALLLFFQQAAPTVADYHGTGREWMVVASIVVPLLLLFLLVYLGSKRTVS